MRSGYFMFIDVICVLFTTILLSGCADRINSVDMAMLKFEDKFIRKVNKKYDLSTFAHGVGHENRKVKEVVLEFSSNSIINEADARKLIVKIANEMIHDMNQDENLLANMCDNPATIYNIELGVNFYPALSNRNNFKDLVSVDIIKGKLFYSKYVPNKWGLESCKEETFEEANEIVSRACNCYGDCEV